jgi:hypothetical protein
MARGDQIYVMRPFAGLAGVYEHHGIDCGDGTVIHYRKTDVATISRTSLAAFAQGNRIFVKQFPVAFIPDIVVQRAESRIGEQQYNLIANNCEHFATWCKAGRSDCEQLTQFGLGVGGVGAAASPPLIAEAAEAGDPIAALALFDQATHNIAVARSHLQLQYHQAQADMNTWHRVAQLALKGQREDLARAALQRKVTHKRAAADVRKQLDQLEVMQQSLDRNRLTAQRRLSVRAV